MPLRRTTWRGQQDRQSNAIAKDRLSREMRADLYRFDAWPGIRRAWLQHLGRQTYHRENAAASAEYAAAYVRECEAVGIVRGAGFIAE